jgi:hypothetical protein
MRARHPSSEALIPIGANRSGGMCLPNMERERVKGHRLTAGDRGLRQLFICLRDCNISRSRRLNADEAEAARVRRACGKFVFFAQQSVEKRSTPLCEGSFFIAE